MDTFYYAALAVVAAALVAALVLVVGSLSVHSVESLMQHRRSAAALAAFGADADLLPRTQRIEAGLIAFPMSLGGALLGAIGLGVFSPGAPTGYWFWWLVCTTMTVAVTAALVWVAIRLAGALTRPWTRRATDPANLRTE